MSTILFKKSIILGLLYQKDAKLLYSQGKSLKYDIYQYIIILLVFTRKRSVAFTQSSLNIILIEIRKITDF